MSHSGDRGNGLGKEEDSSSSEKRTKTILFFLKYSYLDMLGNTKVTLGSYLKYEDLVEEFGDLRRKD